MPRSISVNTSETPATLDLTIYHGESATININQPTMSIALTIGTSNKADPSVELPGSEGVVTITPVLISSLTENRDYAIDIWNMNDEVDPRLVAKGSLRIAGTITPSGVLYATQYLEDGTAIVALSQAQYNALTQDPDTVYLILV